MPDKHYVGLDLVSFSDNGKYKPVSRVTLMIDEENSVTAGDDTGAELVATCYHATQAMADALLAKFKGYEYSAFEAGSANLDPAAELGDGITADGHYSVISRLSDDGNGYLSPSAPGKAELDDEYPSGGPMTQEFNRKIAQTNSRITKTAEQIRLEVSNSLNGLSSYITVELDKITQTVTGLNGKYTSLQTTVDGVTVTDQYGTSRIKGSSIETDSLYVNAANITGTVEASVIRGGTIAIKNYAGVTTATITPGLTTGEGFDLTSAGNLFLAGRYGWFEVNGNAAYVNATNTNGECFCPSGTNLDLGSSTYGLWDAVYALSSTITTSDQNLKHSIEELPDKYLAMMDMLMPKRFQYNSGTSGRYHAGFIAQDVKVAMDSCGIESLEFGGWVKDVDADGNEIYMLRYEEFIAILWAKIRQQEKRLAALEG